jgi:hypothetical protein
MQELAKDFPEGLKYTIVYNPTEFIQQSVDAVVETIGEAVVLVVLVVILFLQTWRAAVIPIIAIPVSLIGTFFFMAIFGFSLNNLSLFGLVLAIGIVVDDAIVVVENVERNIAAGLSPRDAARRHGEGGLCVVAITLVLCAVFGRRHKGRHFRTFYRQFALTIAGATVISLIVSLTLSPALCALLLKPHANHAPTARWMWPVHSFFRLFNRGFEALANAYGRLTARLVRFAVVMLGVYAAIIVFGLNEFRKAPSGFIPQLDAGYLIVVTQLPGGASLARTDALNKRVVDIALQTPGIAHAVNFAGFSGATFTNAPTRRDLPASRAVREARPRSQQIRLRHPGRSVAALRGAPGGPCACGEAAARARHRYVRRLPHDGGGSRQRWAAGPAGCSLRHGGPCRSDAGPLPGRCSRPRPPTLSRHRPRSCFLEFNISDVFAACRPIWGPPTSTTSISSAASSVSRRRLTRPSASTRRMCSRYACAIRAVTLCRSVRSPPCRTLPALTGRRATISIPRPKSTARRHRATRRVRPSS